MKTSRRPLYHNLKNAQAVVNYQFLLCIASTFLRRFNFRLGAQIATRQIGRVKRRVIDRKLNTGRARRRARTPQRLSQETRALINE